MEFVRPSGNSAYKMTDTYSVNDLTKILAHPGDFNQTIEITYNLCISHSKTELINIIKMQGDISQKEIALWVCEKMYSQVEEPYKDEDENENKENVNPNIVKQKTPKYTLTDLKTLFDMECRTLLRKFSNDIENPIDVFVKQALKEKNPNVLRGYIEEDIIKVSMKYISDYPRFTFFIKRLFYDRLVNLMDRLSDVKKNCSIKDCKKIIDYWNSLLSEYIQQNLSEYNNLTIDPINPQTPYAIMGGRRRKLKKTKKKSLRKRKQTRKR